MENIKIYDNQKAIGGIKVFANEQFGKIRVAGTNEAPLFCLSDVCKILDIKNTSDCKSRLSQRGVVICDTPTQNQYGATVIQKMTYVNEGNLYKCILLSRKKEAEVFQDWVTDEVLPSIRKTGSYNSIPRTFSEALRLAADQQELIEKQQQQLLEQKPKVKYFDDLVDRKLNLCFRDTAKEIGIKQSEFIKWLIDNNYIYRDSHGKIKPYSQYCGDLFELKEWNSTNSNISGNQTLVTPKGRETFNLLLNERKGGDE